MVYIKATFSNCLDERKVFTMISALRTGDMQTIIITIGVYLMIIFLITPIHETAHAWAAHKLGDDTAMYKGRISLNPFVHMDPIGTLSMVLFGFGWGKPVPINPLKFKSYRKGIALSALAGPMSNLIAAFFGMIVAKGCMYASINTGSYVLIYLYTIFNLFTSVNIGLAFFNLIPIPPLDGQKVLSYFTDKKFDDFMYRNQLMLTVILFAIINSPLMTIVGNAGYWLIDKATFFVDLIGRAAIN